MNKSLKTFTFYRENIYYNKTILINKTNLNPIKYQKRCPIRR